MLNLTAYAKSQTLVHRGPIDVISLPINSCIVEPTDTPATLTTTRLLHQTHSPPPGKASLSESAISKLTPFHSCTASSMHLIQVIY